MTGKGDAGVVDDALLHRAGDHAGKATTATTLQRSIQQRGQDPLPPASRGRGSAARGRQAAPRGGIHQQHRPCDAAVRLAAPHARVCAAAVGPEQVSPHYESLSRSRRGLIFAGLYVASINTISRFGGWEHNDWLRAMIWHHEFLLAYYIGYIEIRHFTFFIGPKFSIFYNVYSGYEY
jgi:hypothetical protein